MESPSNSFFVVSKNGVFLKDCQGDEQTGDLIQACRMTSYLAAISLAVEAEGSIVKIFSDGARKTILSFEHP
jgi:hypothetical protein